MAWIAVSLLETFKNSSETTVSGPSFLVGSLYVGWYCLFFKIISERVGSGNTPDSSDTKESLV